jgi:hypothetical protein
MRARQPGLWSQAQEAGVKIERLSSGDLLVFLNKRRTSIVIMGKITVTDEGGLMSYWKSPSGRVPMEAIQYIPQSLGADGLDMTAAVRKGLESRLGLAE